MTAEIVIAESDETTREVVGFNVSDSGVDVLAFTDRLPLFVGAIEASSLHRTPRDCATGILEEQGSITHEASV